MVRAGTLTILAFIFAAGVSVPQDRRGKRDWPVELYSKHYDLKSNAAKAQAQDLLDFMELVFETYMAMLKPDDPKSIDSKRFLIILHKDQKDYMAAGAPRGSGAYYNSKSKKLVGYYHPSLTKPFFAHEGMHQFTDVTSKNFRDFKFWFSEGIADCIGNSEVRRKKLYMCVKSGMIARMRLPIIQRALKEGKAYPLSKLLTMDRREFMRNASLCYAQSWSFCHFLLTYPKTEARNKQIPNGRFRKNIAIYYELMRKGGTTHRKAWAVAFKDIPLSELEKAWKKYVLDKLDAGRFLGFNGGEATREQADKLGLDKDKGAIEVSRVAPGTAAEGAGLKKGDFIVRFNGKTFKRGDAMNGLRIQLQKIPYKGAAKVVVIRNGEKKTLKASWKNVDSK